MTGSVVELLRSVQSAMVDQPVDELSDGELKVAHAIASSLADYLSSETRRRDYPRHNPIRLPRYARDRTPDRTPLV